MQLNTLHLKVYIELHSFAKTHKTNLECNSIKIMPKNPKNKRNDSSGSYDQIKLETLSQQSQAFDDDSSAKRRGRKFPMKRQSEKSSDSRSIISQKDTHHELNAEIMNITMQKENEPIPIEVKDSISEGNTTPFLEEDTELILSKEEPYPFDEASHKPDKVEKNEKKQMNENDSHYDETMILQDKDITEFPMQLDQKFQCRKEGEDEFNIDSIMQAEAEDDACFFPDDDNEEFILQFNPNPSKMDEPMEVFRSSFIYTNQYIRVEVYLDKRKKMMIQKIKSIASRKNPAIIEPMESQPPLKSELPNQHGRAQELGHLKRRKKRRTVVTARVLEQIQLQFRLYQQQQKFYGTPCYRRKITLRSIADNLIISPTQIKHLYDQFTTDPLFTMRFAKIDPEGKPGAVSQQLEQIRLKFIEEIVAKNCVLTQQEMADAMNQCQDLLTRDRNGHLLPITRKMVQTLLRKGNYSRKKVQQVPKNRNSPQTIQNRFHYCKKYLDLLAIPSVEIYFLDESRFNMMTVRDRGWAKKGLPATKVTVNSKGKDVILLAIISLSGLVWHELSDGYNAAAFTISMDKVGKLLSERGPNEHRYIIMDNCPIHNRQNLRNIQELHGLKIIYLPPYTPMLNPIEYWFNEVKSNLRQRTYKTRLEMKNSLDAIISRYREKSFLNYYDCIKPYLELGIRRELCKA